MCGGQERCHSSHGHERVCKWSVVKDLAADICVSSEFLMQGFDRT